MFPLVKCFTYDGDFLFPNWNQQSENHHQLCGTCRTNSYWFQSDFVEKLLNVFFAIVHRICPLSAICHARKHIVKGSSLGTVDYLQVNQCHIEQMRKKKNSARYTVYFVVNISFSLSYFDFSRTHYILGTSVYKKYVR